MSSKVVSRIIESRFVRSVTIMFSGTVLAQAIPIALSPILTRLYSPEDFGLAGGYLAVAAVISAVASGRYELAIMLPEDDKDAVSIVVLSMLITVLVSSASLLLIIIFNQQLIAWLRNPQLEKWLYLVPVSVLLAGMYQAMNYWHCRKSRYRSLATNRIVQSGSTAIGQLVPGFANVGVLGLISGSIVGQGIACSYLLTAALKNDRDKMSSFRFFQIGNMAREYSKFPKYDVPSVLLNIAASQAPNILFNSLFSPAAAGFYYLTQRVLQAPITLIAGSVLDVFKQRAADDFNKTGTARPVFVKVLFYLASAALPVAGILYFIIEDLFVLVFGPAWQEAGHYAQLMLPALTLRFMANPLSFMFYIAERQYLNLIGMICMFAVVAASILMAAAPLEAVQNISLGMTVIYVAYILVSYRLTIK